MTSEGSEKRDLLGLQAQRVRLVRLVLMDQPAPREQPAHPGLLVLMARTEKPVQKVRLELLGQRVRRAPRERQVPPE